MAKSMKQIVTEIWKRKGKNADGSEYTFGGKDIIEFVNRETGKVETYQKIKESTNPNIIVCGDNVPSAEDAIDTTEMYGGNGYQRVRFAEAVIAEQTEIPTEDDI